MANVLLSRSINPKQVNMSEYIYPKGWDTENEIGLIEWHCGWGKTYVAVSTTANSILSRVNSELGLSIKPYEVLFLASRRLIKEQTLNNYDSLLEVSCTDELADSGWIEEPDSIRIATYHKIGDDIQSGKPFPSNVKLVICDEFHSLFADTFASQMFAVKKWLSETPIIRIGLTATPQLLEYLNGSRHWTQEACGEQFGFKFRNIAARTEPRFTFEQFGVIGSSMSIETAFRLLRGTEEAKSIFFTFSSKSAGNLAASNDDCLLFVSEGNNKLDKFGNRIASSMNWDKNQELINSGKIPSGYNNVLATSCFREGVDLKDSSVSNIVIQSFLPHEIIQSLGRFRNDAQRVYIVASRASFEIANKECLSAFEFLENYLASHNEALLAEQYSRQLEAQEQGGCQWFVNKYRGKYEIDYSVFAYWLYVYDSWYAATNYLGADIAFCGKKLTTRKEFYKEMFNDYTDNPIEYIPWDKTKTRLALYNERQRALDSVVEPYLNKKLFSDSPEREELVSSVGAIDEYGKHRKWTTVKKWLKDKGYEIEEGREKSKRYSIIRASLQ